MYPKLFGVEFLNMYGLLIAVGIIICLWFFRLNTTKKEVPENPYNNLLILALISVAIGFLFSFLFQMLYDGIAWAAKPDPKPAFRPGGITFLGGMVGGVGSFLIIFRFFGKQETKLHFWTMTNLAVPSFLIAHAIGRLGCLCAGCCYGIEVEGPGHGGLHFPSESASGEGWFIPTMLYESIFLFIMFGISMLLIHKTKKGTNYQLAFYCVGYAVFRFIIEFYRGDDRGAIEGYLSPSQIQSIIMAAVGIGLFVFVNMLNHIPYLKSAAAAIAARPPEKPKTSNEFYDSAEFYENDVIEREIDEGGGFYKEVTDSAPEPEIKKPKPKNNEN